LHIETKILLLLFFIFFALRYFVVPRDLDIINLVGVLSGWSGLVIHHRGEGTGEGHKIVSLDCYCYYYYYCYCWCQHLLLYFLHSRVLLYRI